MEGNNNTNYMTCPTCKGRGFYSVDYHLVEEETWARCDDCEGKGKLEYDKKEEE